MDGKPQGLAERQSDSKMPPFGVIKTTTHKFLVEANCNKKFMMKLLICEAPFSSFLFLCTAG